MENKLDLRGSLERVLDAHRKGIRDRMRTLQTLQLLFEAQEQAGRSEICEHLEHLLRSESLQTQIVEGVGVNIPALAILALSAFGPTQTTISAAFSRASLENQKEIEQWASEIRAGLQYALTQYASRFTEETLENVKSQCLRLRPIDRAIPLPFLQSLQSLEKVAERVEFERFEEALYKSAKNQLEQVPILDSLLSNLREGSNISLAKKNAENYLKGQGEFDPKIAADLIRTSIDEMHRAVVNELERIHIKPCVNKEKDGSRRAYMRDISFISAAEGKFFSAIYALISEEASHKLIAPRETVTVLFGTVRDYLILLVKRLTLTKRLQTSA
jgi:hypothetical protein